MNAYEHTGVPELEVYFMQKAIHSFKHGCEI
jgi:hypothetical protein